MQARCCATTLSLRVVSAECVQVTATGTVFGAHSDSPRNPGYRASSFPCSLRQLISIPLSLASIALAYGDKALSHNNDPAFRSLDIAFEEMIKILMT